VCLSIPRRVVAIGADDTAVVDASGRAQPVALFGVAADVGDWLLVHSGIALARLDPAEAEIRLRLVDRAVGG